MKNLNKQKLINITMILYVLSILLDLHIFYNPVSTLIRIIFISLIFLIIFIKYSTKKEKKLLITYFILLLIYIILHLVSTSNFKVETNYNLYEELLYFIKMSMNILIIYSIYKLSISKNKFYKLIEISAFIISFSIIITNIFKIGYTSYNFQHPKYNIFEWFYKDTNFLEASTKGFFHLTNQISGILLLYIGVLLLSIKNKQKIFNTITLTLSVISMFMLGTRVSSYSVFIILGISLIGYILTTIKDSKIKLSIILTHIILLLMSILLYKYSPLQSRNAYYNELFKEREVNRSSITIEEALNLSDKEFKKLLLNYNIVPEFYNKYYPLEKDRDFYEEYISRNTTKINDTRYLEASIIKRVKSLNNNNKDNIYGIGYNRIMNIFNIENDFIMQYYSVGYIGVIMLLGVYVVILIYLYLKTLFNLEKYFTYENGMLLFITTYYLICSFYTGNILNAISTILPLSFVMGYHLSIMNKKEKEDFEYFIGFKTSTKNIEEITDEIMSSEKQNIIYNINPLILMNFYKDIKSVDEFNKENYNIPDGNGIVLSSKLTSGNINKSIPGVELFEKICQFSVKKKYKIYLYGAKQSSVYNTKVGLETKYKGIKIVGFKNGYISEKEAVNDIIKTKPDILFVALGSPKQEKFIMKNKNKFKNIKIIMPVGGTFDVVSKNTLRAPLIYRNLKLEWLYRMIKEPKRFKQLGTLFKYMLTILFLNTYYNRKAKF